MIKDLRSKIRSRKTSCVEVSKEYLERAEKLNPKLNAYISITKDIALEEAEKLDKEIASTKDLDGLLRSKPLLGIPVGLKDIYLFEKTLINLYLLDTVEKVWIKTILMAKVYV